MALDNKKQILIIIIAVATGIGAAVMTSRYVEEKIQKQTRSLAQDFEQRQQQTVEALQRDSAMKIQGLAAQMEQMKAEQQEAMQKQLAALQAVQAQKQQEQVKKRKPSLALRTPDGKRAVTVMIDSLAAVGGLLNPGDFVDVLAELKVPTGDPDSKDTRTHSITAMVFQGLEVLAVNTNLDDPGAYDDQQAAPSLKVTVAVDPREAGLLAFADRNGKLELALRSPNERSRQMVKASTWKTLADYVLQNQGADIRIPDALKEENKPLEQPKENKPSIQIFRGGKEL